MKSIIREDDIEQAICTRLSLPEFGWKRIECDPSVAAQDDVSKTGRANPSECILPEVFRNALKRLNPWMDEEMIEGIVNDYRKDYTGTDMVETNYRFYNQLRNGIKLDTRTEQGDDFDIVKLIDFEHVENNDFHCVNQMWIKGHYNYRRPDVLLFVNGLPVVFVELKNSTVKVEEAYNKNLVSYRKDIPNIFALNQICVLSNGLMTKMGAWNAGYEYFFEWLRVNDEKEHIDREKIAEYGLSVTNLMDGLFRKERLIDYIENFVFFDNKRTKIIAKNHQYLGVNNLMANVERRGELKGKLGVFWHTQGSGKSYSMVMFVRKVRRKVKGNFTFLVITDREDLDTQIHKTFVRTEVIGPKEECQPKDSAQLREYLSSNKTMLFTLIHKFGYDKSKKYPLLTERDDIFVLVDEAHRTQYKQLAENMHTGIPNANYIAFTGTPLLGSKRLTGNVMGLTGSAPTALSMVAVYVLHNMSMTPVHIAEFSIGSNCESRPEKLLSDGARSLGMTVTEVPRNNNRLSQAVKEKGSAVICMMKSQEFSSFIVVKGVDEDGNFLIIDPSNKKRSETHYSFSQLNTGIKRIWKYSTVSEDNP